MDSLTPAEATALFAFMAAFSVVFLTILLIGYIISSVLLSLIFKKADEAMWKAWVPFYNMWVLFEIGGYKGWLGVAVPIVASVLASVPFVGFAVAVASFVLYVFVSLNVQKAFGKTGPFILWYIFIPVVWFAILGLDKSEYDKAKLDVVSPEFLAKTV